MSTATHRRPALALALPLALLLLCAAVADARTLRQQKEDVEVAATRFEAAFNRLVPSGMARFYARDAVLVSPAGTVRGRPGIIASYRMFFMVVTALRARTTRITRAPRGRFVQVGRYVMERRDGAPVRGAFRFVWRPAGGATYVLERDENMPDPPSTPSSSSSPPSPAARRAPARLAADVRIELARFAIAFNRRDAAQMARFYTAHARMSLPGLPTARGRGAIVALYRQLFRDGVRGVRFSDVSVRRGRDGKYVVRGRYVVRTGAATGDGGLFGTFRQVWKFVGRRPVIMEDVARADR